MNRVLLNFSLSLMIISQAIASQKSVESAQPKIVVHHYHQGAGHGVLKWDCPVFVAYADGPVVWRKQWTDSIDAFTATEGQTAIETVRKIEAMMKHYGGKTFRLTDSNDPEETTVWFLGKTLTIFGDWQKSRLYEAFQSNNIELNKVPENERKLWSTLPAEVRDGLALIVAFDDKKGKAWRPEKLSLLLQPPNLTRIKPVVWPAQWPRSFITIPGSQAMQSIELPGSMLEDLLKLLPDDGEPKAILVNGEARYVEIRFIFPGQVKWNSSGPNSAD